MTPALAHQRCLHHPGREAASRCPGCRRYFCRECVTEHGGRVLCRQCLAPGEDRRTRRGVMANVWWTGAALAGMTLAWSLFHWAGALLAGMPDRLRGGQ